MTDAPLAALRAELEAFLYHEATLLDDRRYEEWLALLAPDVAYWVPNFEDATQLAEGVILYENLQALRARVVRAFDKLSPVQLPPPRTRHFITNIVVSSALPDEADVQSNFLLYVSKDRRVLHFPGKVEHKLRKIEGAWRIVLKKIYLMTNDEPMGSLPIL
jgi:3-phenylpropionate/cinnamic acid dioxygenase small subunit